MVTTQIGEAIVKYDIILYVTKVTMETVAAYFIPSEKNVIELLHECQICHVKSQNIQLYVKQRIPNLYLILYVIIYSIS